MNANACQLNHIDLLPVSGPTRRLQRRFSLLFPLLALFLVLCAGAASAQTASTNVTTGFGPLQITLGGNNAPQDLDMGIKVLFTITLLTLAPSILLLMTCFTRIVIVLSFVRTALQLQGTPANQIIIGLSLFITFFVMAPVWENINRDAIAPYQAQADSPANEALDRASQHLRTFMLKQARPKDVELFASHGQAAAHPPRGVCRCAWSSPVSSSANCAPPSRWAF